MATHREADVARRRHADLFEAVGVHAVGVEPAIGSSKGEYVVVVYLDDKAQASLPRNLSITFSGRKVTVPLTLRREERFQLE